VKQIGGWQITLIGYYLDEFKEGVNHTLQKSKMGELEDAKGTYFRNFGSGADACWPAGYGRESQGH
jgi:hypothetical protein